MQNSEGTNGFEPSLGERRIDNAPSLGQQAIIQNAISEISYCKADTILSASSVLAWGGKEAIGPLCKLLEDFSSGLIELDKNKIVNFYKTEQVLLLAVAAGAVIVNRVKKEEIKESSDPEFSQLGVILRNLIKNHHSESFYECTFTCLDSLDLKSFYSDMYDAGVMYFQKIIDSNHVRESEEESALLMNMFSYIATYGFRDEKLGFIRLEENYRNSSFYGMSDFGLILAEKESDEIRERAYSDLENSNNEANLIIATGVISNDGDYWRARKALEAARARLCMSTITPLYFYDIKYILKEDIEQIKRKLFRSGQKFTL